MHLLRSREPGPLEHIVTGLTTRDAYFWATHGGAELDLLVLKAGKRFGFELKYSDAPNLQRSMHVALEDLGLDKLWVVVPGGRPYELHEKVSVIPLSSAITAVAAVI